jgi:hypothetical protein
MTSNDDALSIRYTHAMSAYKTMVDEAQEVTGEGGQRMLVWEGFLTKLIRDHLQLSTPMFSEVRNNLKNMGCIRQLQRGGSTTPSKWELLREPTEELWRSMPARKTNTKTSQLEQQVKDLGHRVEKIEQALAGGMRIQ